MEEEFKQGEIVEHKLTKEWLMVLFFDEKKSTYTCRTKGFEEIVIYSFELQKRR
jgi:hypothetical protein